MRGLTVRKVRQVLVQKGAAKAFAALLCVSLVLPPQLGVASALAHLRAVRGGG